MTTARRRVMVITGSRAEYGLLRPVMRAVAEHPALDLIVIAAGTHLISPADTLRDVKADFHVDDVVPMQIAGRVGRDEDAESVARGVARFTRAYQRFDPDWIVLLGDRIEPFAAAIAAAVSGRAVAHIHGGDRAEGVADESMRHAITKLAHLHFPATPQSGERVMRMGENPDFIDVVGSPAIDDLAGAPMLSDAEWGELGSPRTLLLLHPIGRSDAEEFAAAGSIFEAVAGRDVLWLAPNHDPGRAGIVSALHASHAATRDHLPRAAYVGLLRRLASMRGPQGGVIVGNSSSALIESAAVGVPAVDIGVRQRGRESGSNTVRCPDESAGAVRAALESALRLGRDAFQHPFGDGRAGIRVAERLARTDPRASGVLRKRCRY